MFNLYLYITQDHNLLVLLLAAAVCVVSVFAGLFMLDRARQRSGAASLAWLAAAGAVFGGGGVWVTHFVAILGYDAGMPLSFRVQPSFLSAMIAMFGAAGAFYLLRRGSGAPWRVVSAGIVLGASVAAMHYLGMQGVLVPGAFSWAPGYVVASILLSLGFSLLCVLVYSRTHGTTWRRSAWRLGSATALGVLAVFSLHFTAMTGLGITPDGSRTDYIAGVSRSTMAGLIVSRAMFLVMIGLAAAALDAVLSERRRAEEMRLRALVDQLRESERRLHDANEAKSQFLSRMSHEFRTPLNGIVGLASILRRDASGDQARMLEMIASCGQSLGSMVDAIIDLARFEDDAFTLDCNPFELGAMLGRLESDYRPKAQAKGLRFAVLADLEDAGSVTGDQERIRQILSGLIDNAIKFTADGEVRVAARCLPDADDGVRRLEFLVDDTGGGVPDDASVAIFELFGQADSAITRRQDGAGLGLSLARRLCVAMDGGLTFERLPHGGSRFRAEIVLGCAAAPHAAVNDRAMAGRAA